MSSRSTSIAALRGATGAVLCGSALIVALVDWVGMGGPGIASFANGPLYDAVVIGAALACLLKALDSGAERTAWLAIAAAIFLWGAAEVYWTAEIDGNPSAPYPSPADIGYLAFYPLAAVGLVLLVRARTELLDWRLWADGLIAALGTAALGAAVVFEFVADRTSGTALEVATTLSYPLGDILMVALVVGVVALTRWPPGRTWTLLLLGLATMAFADIAYTLQANGVDVPSGDWVEPFYLLAALFVGAVAWWGSEADAIQPEARFDGWHELAIPGFFALVMVGLSVLQYFNGANGFTTVMWAATMLAVLARLAITVAENKRLLEQVRTDALTGLGNQGRMQVDLQTSCERAEGRPTTLLMLDLNGFKHYNDSFGHPAGDTMLMRLGARLRDAVGIDGTAYRIGGDEFGVLIESENDHLEVSMRAAEALRAQGNGFEVGAAWGTASIPSEASTPAAAMQLADIRMYAQKESRNLPAQADSRERDGAALDIRLGRARGGEALEQGQ